MQTFDELLQEAEAAHGHLCAGQVLGVRRPLVAMPIAKWTEDEHPSPACPAATWQRQPLQVVFHPPQ